MVIKSLLGDLTASLFFFFFSKKHLKNGPVNVELNYREKGE